MENPATIDGTDIKILHLLQEDGRMPWVELAERANLSASACQRRVQAMQDRGVIEDITARLDPAALGYEVAAYVAVNVERQDLANAERFRAAIRDYPEVQACYMLSGAVDYLLQVVATDLKAFGRFIEEKILSVPGVKDASSSIVLDCVKSRSRNLPDAAAGGR